jgi:hypothetical protein
MREPEQPADSSHDDQEGSSEYQQRALVGDRCHGIEHPDKIRVLRSVFLFGGIGFTELPGELVALVEQFQLPFGGQHARS